MEQEPNLNLKLNYNLETGLYQFGFFRDNEFVADIKMYAPEFERLSGDMIRLIKEVNLHYAKQLESKTAGSVGIIGECQN